MLRRLPLVVACSTTSRHSCARIEIETTVIGTVSTRRSSSRPRWMNVCVRERRWASHPTRCGPVPWLTRQPQGSTQRHQAVRALADPGLVMLLVGGGALEQECRRAAHDDESVSASPDTWPTCCATLQATDFLVLGFKGSEGLPNSGLESTWRADCLLVLSADRVRTAKCWRVAPSAGVLVPVGDVAAIGRCVAHRYEARTGRSPVPGAGTGRGSSSARSRYRGAIVAPYRQLLDGARRPASAAARPHQGAPRCVARANPCFSHLTLCRDPHL